MNFYKTGLWLVAIGVAFILFFSVVFLTKTNEVDTAYSIDSGVWGQYGDVIGGFAGTLVALAGVFMLFETLKEQRKAFIKQQVESRFFELIKLHKENVAEMKSKGKTGRDVFVLLRDDVNNLYQQIKTRYPQNAIDNEKNSSAPDWKNEIVQMAYMIVFYGVNNTNDEESIRFIEELTKARGKGNDVVTFFRELVQNHQTTKTENENLKLEKRNQSGVGGVDFQPKRTKKYLNHDGQQVRLAHYFRHLYHTVKYINDQPKDLFTYDEKRHYIEILRAQLSTHEQAILFYNSLSGLGKPWELGRPPENIDTRLITKYNLIRNMPRAFTGEIDPKYYYPDVYFEYDSDKTKRKKELVELYT